MAHRRHRAIAQRERIAAICLSTRRPAFDNAESRLTACKRHVVGHYRLGEALEGERADLFGCDASPERDIDALTEQNLAVRGLGTKTGGDIAHRADRRIAGALGEPDPAQRRIAFTPRMSTKKMSGVVSPSGTATVSMKEVILDPLPKFF